jgi:hypothetical protein
MKKLLLITLVLSWSCLVAAQDTQVAAPTVSSVLDGLKGTTWTVRSSAFGDATELLNSGKLGPNETESLRLAIIQLLIKENSGGLKEPDPPDVVDDDESYGEQKADYYASLIAFVAGMQDERAIPALLGAANSGGMATRAVARFGVKALDPTLEQAISNNPHQASGALFVILQMLKLHTVSDPDSHLRIKNALRSALASSHHETREDAISTIEYLDDREEFVPLLQQIAKEDPYRVQSNAAGSKASGHYAVRHSAELLLHKIANHEQPSVDTGLSH